MNEVLGKRIVALSQRIVSNFDLGLWTEVGLLTGTTEAIESYPRLLRSLRWEDPDYSGNVLGLLRHIAEENPGTFQKIERYVAERFPDEEEYVSSRPAERRITFAPNVFAVPDVPIEPDLVSAMMPMSQDFSGTYAAIQRACKGAGLRCLRADDIWAEQVMER